MGEEIGRIKGQDRGLVLGHRWPRVQMDICSDRGCSEGEYPADQSSVTFRGGLRHHLLDDLLHVGNSQLQPPPAHEEELQCIINEVAHSHTGNAMHLNLHLQIRKKKNIFKLLFCQVSFLIHVPLELMNGAWKRLKTSSQSNIHIITQGGTHLLQDLDLTPRGS